MKKKLFSNTLIALGALILLTGCGSSNQQASSSSNKSAASSSAKKNSSKEKKMITVKDTNGSIKVPKNPQKVVVFDNGSLDTIDALGKGKAIVGAPTKNLPKYLAKYQKVASAGGIKEPDIEKVNQLKPDLIIISGRQRNFQDKLSKIAPTMFMQVNEQDTWNSTKQNILTLGKIFDEETKAQDKIAGLEKDIATLKNQAQASKKKALVALINEGQISVYGLGSRFGIIHDTFGFSQADSKIKPSIHGQSVSYEYVLEKNPDILFLVDRTKAIGGDDSKNKTLQNDLVKQTKAGKNQQVINLEPDVWYLSGGGIESTATMIKDVNSVFESAK